MCVSICLQEELGRGRGSPVLSCARLCPHFPGHGQTYSTCTSLYRAHPLLLQPPANMFKLIRYEVHTFDKRAVRLKYLLTVEVYYIEHFTCAAALFIHSILL